MQLSIKSLSVSFAASLFLSLGMLPASGQVRPVYDRGTAGLTQLVKRLNTNASALMIGAHPDDEDTALLAYLARGENARTAYLSLTRGDGGQNIIGPELGEALGVIRTEELLQARTLDGAEQYFTRAYDYGFSKTLAEARERWDEKIILCDVVRVIRHFRPLVVISQFSGTAADGHGQHQFAGYLSPIAVSAAADATHCPDAGNAWKVQKFYVRHRGQGEPTLRINTGKYDSLLGRSYFEIAMEARSQHKSQEQGVLELRGDHFSSLKLVSGTESETSIFQGVNTTDVGQPTFKEGPDLLRDLSNAYTASPRKREIAAAIALVAGLRIDALADSETVVAGEAFTVGVKSYAVNDLIKVKNVVLTAPYSWTVETSGVPEANTPANVIREAGLSANFFRVTPSAQSQWYTRPYWLVEPREGDMFRWKTDFGEGTLPFGPTPLTAKVKAEVFGNEIEFERGVEFRFADDIRGEIRRNVEFVPKLNVEMDQPLILVNTATMPQTKRVTMTVTNLSNSPVTATPSLFLGSNALSAKPLTKEFSIKRKGETASVSWDITLPANTRPGRYTINGEAKSGNTFYVNSMRTVAYPHIQTRRFYKPNETVFQVLDLKTSPAKVGYIEGSGDQVFEAITQMGFNAETISPVELATGNLSRFDTIIVGIRAYQVRPDVVANNERLLDFARRGGTLIVQYQLPDYVRQKLVPFPTDVGPRTADEKAAVQILDPTHPVMTVPNQITSADFDGWVQERNLYNFSKFSSEYTGLLETHDAGEAENQGGLVVANIGEGKYIYCSYSLFRQLPAGVPGAYRLLANMLAYSGTKAPGERRR